MEIKEIEKFYQSRLDEGLPVIEKIESGGSARRYYKVKGEGYHAVATFGDNTEENRAFIELGRLFQFFASTPVIYGEFDEGKGYLQSWHGGKSLLSVIESAHRGEVSRDEMMKICKKALFNLISIQQLPEELWTDRTFNPPFKGRSVGMDLNYFKYDFLKLLIEDYDEEALEEDFEKIKMGMDEIPEELIGFMYRDFQSRNIMVETERIDNEGVPEICLIDFQGGRKGPVLYDLVSFLWQAKAGFSEDERVELFNWYVEQYFKRLREMRSDWKPDIHQLAEAINRNLTFMLIIRQLQVLGAYGYRGLIQHNSHFIESIPAALGNLKEMIDDGDFDEYPELKKVCDKICRLERFKKENSSDVRLAIEVISFSYRKGYPDDLSGNGGGFVFDCRGLQNPGRFDEYKSKTGRDEDVKEFLERHSNVGEFMSSCYSLVDSTVEVYRQRGFTHLQVGFGCTGGRHRSVYCAESMVKHLTEKYPDVEIILNHREQGITNSFNAAAYSL